MSTMKLTQLIPTERLQQVQDQFSLATGFAAILVDYRGKPVTEPSGFTNFCTTIRLDPERQQGCFTCDAHGGFQGAIAGEPHIYICHAGLVDFSVPLMLDDDYLGAMMCGQVRLSDQGSPPPTLPMPAGLPRYDDHFAMLRADVPVVSLARVQAVAETLNDLMNTLIGEARLRGEYQPAEDTEDDPRVVGTVTRLPVFGSGEQNTAPRIDIDDLRGALNDDDLPRAVAAVHTLMDELFRDDRRRVGRGLLRQTEDDICELTKETHPDAAQEVAQRVAGSRSRSQSHWGRFEAQNHIEGLVMCVYAVMERQQARRPRTVVDLINRLERSPTCFLTLQSAAKFVNLSPHHLSRVFKNHTGSTFTDYVTKKRIDRAMFLLRYTDQPVLRIANDLAFKPANYFSRAFKASVGVTPSDYRRAPEQNPNPKTLEDTA